MKYKHIHFIGIKGVAMTALAIYAKEKGIKVTGSDTQEDFPTKEVLEKYKIKPLVDFKKENLKGNPDLVIVTGAHSGMNNPEAVEAKKMGLKVLTHGQALAEISGDKKVIAVSGSHGKTTVAALISHLMMEANLDPSFCVGCGQINSLKTPGHFGKGEYFVVEADEYVTDPQNDPTPRFFWLTPKIAVITNIDFDHPDAYRNIDEVRQSFITFAKKVPKDGLLVLGIDNQNARSILPLIDCPKLTYGFSPQADFQVNRTAFIEGHTWFWLKFKGRDLGQFSLKIPGKFNALNATAAGIVASNLGIPWDKIKESLGTFTGTKRRFENLGEIDGVRFIDDYAHHPDQIKNTLEACKAWFPKSKLYCIFQPHTYSRTKALFLEFSKSFSKADEVIISDIYSSAREKPDPSINSQILVSETLKHNKNSIYLSSLEEIANYLKKRILSGDIVITMGAGDVYKLYNMIQDNPESKI